jgi:hypothetical protein
LCAIVRHAIAIVGIEREVPNICTARTAWRAGGIMPGGDGMTAAERAPFAKTRRQGNIRSGGNAGSEDFMARQSG